MYDKGEDVILRNAPALIIAHGSKDNQAAESSCTIALATMELAAKGCGLGACWAGFLMNVVKQGYEPALQALKIPENEVFHGAMMLGYPKFSYKRIPVRNKPVITWNS